MEDLDVCVTTARVCGVADVARASVHHAAVQGGVGVDGIALHGWDAETPRETSKEGWRSCALRGASRRILCARRGRGGMRRVGGVRQLCDEACVMAVYVLRAGMGWMSYD